MELVALSGVRPRQFAALSPIHMHVRRCCETALDSPWYIEPISLSTYPLRLHGRVLCADACRAAGGERQALSKWSLGGASRRPGCIKAATRPKSSASFSFSALHVHVIRSKTSDIPCTFSQYLHGIANGWVPREDLVLDHPDIHLPNTASQFRRQKCRRRHPKLLLRWLSSGANRGSLQRKIRSTAQAGLWSVFDGMACQKSRVSS